MSGLLGKKIGMTRIFDESGNVIPVTVVKMGPCYVTQVKTMDTDGYRAVQLGFDTKKEKNTVKPMMGHLKKAGAPPVRVLKEFLLNEKDEFKLGDIIKVDMFKPGDPIKVTGLGKGRGFAGAMKRHGFSGAQTTHGQSDRTRAPGSLGQSSYPSRVFRGMKMAGRMGNNRVSVKGLVVVKVDAENDLLFIKGAIPGARNSYVEVYKR